jgi:hypothetical protein
VEGRTVGASDVLGVAANWLVLFRHMVLGAVDAWWGR